MTLATVSASDPLMSLYENDTQVTVIVNIRSLKDQH